MHINILDHHSSVASQKKLRGLVIQLSLHFAFPLSLLPISHFHDHFALYVM